MAGITQYIKDSYTELVEKVSWPTFEELQDSVIVVMIASVIIAMIIFAMDGGFQYLMNLIYKMA